MSGVSIGVCAYNEENNLLPCLQSISSQELSGFELVETIVVSSGSTDRTDEIARAYEKRDPRAKLVVQQERKGKNAAINLFMGLAKGDILVLVNADNRLTPGCLQALLEPFRDPKVGVAGGHPVPTNPKDSFSGFAVHMLWDMHHRVALIDPKIGELMAFRPLGLVLPEGTQSDEDLIRMESEKRGLRTVYVPGAVVNNRGPGDIGDFLRQRARVNIGERYMRRWYGVRFSTWDIGSLMKAYAGFASDNRRHLLRVFVAVLMEIGARGYASLHVALNKGDRPVWEQVRSTKDFGR
ncbi:MAG: glycosyltransferase [Methanomassiliicoccales archaeon]|jgi:cellulose synthase/poly-beta-1,6-N-acetylglucosamine synthase-like glycosyltransferase